MGARALPVQTATGQPYGAAGQQAAAQQAVPLAPPPGPSTPAGASPSPQRVQPGSLGDFGGPTTRPNEHVMTPPPPGPPDMSTANLGSLLNQMGQTNAAVAQLAAYVNSGKQ